MHAVTTGWQARCTVLLTTFGLLLGVSALMALPASASCSVMDDPNCVSVGATDPGSGGLPGSPGVGDPGDDPGVVDPGGVAVGGQIAPPPVCQWRDAAAQPTDPGDPRLEGHAPGSGVVQDWVCVTYAVSGGAVGFGPTGTTRFVPDATGGAVPVLPSPGVLAVQAAASFLLPSPSWGRFPAFVLKDGRPYTVVRTRMWFWTDASVWHPLTATARAGANWATVTATPVALALVPGDGNPAVSCASPGTPFDPARDAYPTSWVPQPQPAGCDYTYARSTWNYPAEMLTATLSIRWVLSWTGSGNTAGTLTARVTSTDSTFMVAELQAVVVK